MTTVAFTGMPGSGKTEAVKIAQKQDIKVVRMGDIIWEEVKRRGLKINDDNVGRIASELRVTQGKDICAQRILLKIREDTVVIDGVRSYEEVETFKKRLTDFTLVAIHASPTVRYHRILQRQRPDDATTLEQVKKRDARELAWGIGNVIAMADKMFINEGNLDELRIFVDNVLGKKYNARDKNKKQYLSGKKGEGIERR